MEQHDLIVIGAGPGGYIAAIRAAQLGMKVACVEEEPALGGTCLRVGCIPSKALLEASERFHEASHRLSDFGVRVQGVELDLARMLQKKSEVVATLTHGVDLLFKKNRIRRYFGHGRLIGRGRLLVEGEERIEVSASHILIATGSRPASLRGVPTDGDRITGSTEALSYPEVPERLVVIGAGYIGLELGSVWRRLGSKVTVVEYQERILPGMDSELAAEAERIFESQGLEFRLGTTVNGARVDGSQVVLELDVSKEPLVCDRALVAIGRVPNTTDLGLEAVGIELDPVGRIPIDDQFRTYVPGLYAVGDVVRGPMLAHKASEEGIACVEGIATGVGHVNYEAIPGVVYTEPEIASVGKTEDELKELKIPYKKGVFPLSASGRARALGNVEGRVKLLAHSETDRILGVHVIGPRAGDLIAEAVVAIEFGASAEDLARSSHAHPTLAEAVKEAALAADGRALHI